MKKRVWIVIAVCVLSVALLVFLRFLGREKEDTVQESTTESVATTTEKQVENSTKRSSKKQEKTTRYEITIKGNEALITVAGGNGATRIENPNDTYATAQEPSLIDFDVE